MRHPGVDKISFTGSTGAGKQIASICGEQLKRYSLELGGKSAAIILEDADLEPTLARLLPATINNNGQVCVNQTRILAPQGRYDEVVEAFTEGYRALAVGDPMDPGTDVGPLIHGASASASRATSRIGPRGGRAPDVRRRPPRRIRPRLLRRADDLRRRRQRDEDRPGGDLRPRADDHPLRRRRRGRPDRQRLRLGLSGSVWGADDERAAGIARRVRTGNIGVNLFTLDFAGAVRRLQAVGHRPRVRPRGDRRVHRDPVAAPRQAARPRPPRTRPRASAARAACASEPAGVVPMSASARSHALYSRITPSGSPSSAGDPHHQPPGGLAVRVGLAAPRGRAAARARGRPRRARARRRRGGRRRRARAGARGARRPSSSARPPGTRRDRASLSAASVAAMRSRPWRRAASTSRDSSCSESLTMSTSSRQRSPARPAARRARPRAGTRAAR